MEAHQSEQGLSQPHHAASPLRHCRWDSPTSSSTTASLPSDDTLGSFVSLEDSSPPASYYATWEYPPTATAPIAARAAPTSLSSLNHASAPCASALDRYQIQLMELEQYEAKRVAANVGCRAPPSPRKSPIPVEDWHWDFSAERYEADPLDVQFSSASSTVYAGSSRRNSTASEYTVDGGFPDSEVLTKYSSTDDMATSYTIVHGHPQTHVPHAQSGSTLPAGRRRQSSPFDMANMQHLSTPGSATSSSATSKNATRHETQSTPRGSQRSKACQTDPATRSLKDLTVVADVMATSFSGLADTGTEPSATRRTSSASIDLSVGPRTERAIRMNRKRKAKGSISMVGRIPQHPSLKLKEDNGRTPDGDSGNLQGSACARQSNECLVGMSRRGLQSRQQRNMSSVAQQARSWLSGVESVLQSDRYATVEERRATQRALDYLAKEIDRLEIRSYDMSVTS